MIVPRFMWAKFIGVFTKFHFVFRNIYEWRLKYTTKIFQEIKMTKFRQTHNKTEHFNPNQNGNLAILIKKGEN